MTYVHKDGVGFAWQASCPRKIAHKSAVKGAVFCKQKLNFSTEEDSEQVQLRLKHWLNSCMKCATRLGHMSWKPSFEDCPSKEQVDAAELQPEDVDEDVEQHQPAKKKQKTSILPAVASSSTKELSPCVDKASSSSAGSSGSSSSRPKSSTDSDNYD